MAPVASDETGPTATEGPGPDGNESTNVWPDEAAEAAFLTDAGARRQCQPGGRTAADATEETDTQGLPPLEELVKRISPRSGRRWMTFSG